MTLVLFSHLSLHLRLSPLLPGSLSSSLYDINHIHDCSFVLSPSLFHPHQLSSQNDPDKSLSSCLSTNLSPYTIGNPYLNTFNPSFLIKMIATYYYFLWITYLKQPWLKSLIIYLNMTCYIYSKQIIHYTIL